MRPPITCAPSWASSVPDLILIDNDVVLKACRLALAPDLIALLEPRGQAAILGSARFVLHNRLARRKDVADRASATAALDGLLLAVPAVEPVDGEVMLAAQFEELAQTLGLALEGGESLLFSILVLRPAALLATGDKRAIAAAEAVLARLSAAMGPAIGKVACLEQVVAALLGVLGPEALRRRVCADPEADKALAICFGCGSPSFSGADAAQGLGSYVGAVRCSAPTLLLPSGDLSAFLAQEHGVGRP